MSDGKDKSKAGGSRPPAMGTPWGRRRTRAMDPWRMNEPGASVSPKAGS